MKECQVADQGHGAAILRWCAIAAPIAVDTVPSIPATPRFDHTFTPGGCQADERRIADRVRRAKQQLVALAERVGHRSRNV